MLHSSYFSAHGARADGFGRRRSDTTDHRYTQSSNFLARSPTPMQNVASSTSAFHTPSVNHSMTTVAHGSPPGCHDIMMKPHIDQVLRSSPTSVGTGMYFDGRPIYDLPKEFDFENMNSSPVDRHVSLRVRQRSHFYADPTVGYHYAREAPLEPLPVLTPPRGMAETATVMCHPCKPKPATPMPAHTTTRNLNSVKFNLASSASSGDRRSANQGPNICAGDDGERPPPTGNGCGNDSHPTPQNLRDNPERQAKVKTEMCHYYENGNANKCPFGANCNYAHGKHELKFRYTTLCLMEGSGQIANAKTYLARPCMTWVSTGACPFGRRCAAIHDPFISNTSEYPSWLPAAPAKTNAQIIVDRLAAHRESIIHQENPLISQSIWENCRPSRHVRNKEHVIGSDSVDNANKSIFNLEQEWRDTYSLVCNIDASIFTRGRIPVRAPSNKLSDLQKLCIAHAIRRSDGPFQQEPNCSRLHRDYIFAPTHSLQSELCMILQDRYFLLLDVNFTSATDVSPKDIAKEISFNDYKYHTTPWSSTEYSFDPSKCVTAHEVAFAPKGDHSANVSIWFDAIPAKLEQSQIKRSRRLKQKKMTQIRNDHTHPNANGALISRTSSSDFPTRPPDIDPFVPMLPAEDQDKSNDLIMAIMQHRIDYIILESCLSVNEEQKKKLYLRMKKLQKTFMSMAKFHEKWTWPKREGMGHVTVTTKAPPGNIMPYITLKNNKKNHCVHTWHAFTQTIGALNAQAVQSPVAGDTKRLGIFLFLDGSIPRTNHGGQVHLPHILSNVGGSHIGMVHASPETDITWKEILLGQPENGIWEAALRIHNKKTEAPISNTNNKARDMPLSTIPFVQV